MNKSKTAFIKTLLLWKDTVNKQMHNIMSHSDKCYEESTVQYCRNDPQSQLPVSTALGVPLPQ